MCMFPNKIKKTYTNSMFFRLFIRKPIIYTITEVVSANSDHGEVYSIQYYVIKFVRD